MTPMMPPERFRSKERTDVIAAVVVVVTVLLHRRDVSAESTCVGMVYTICPIRLGLRTALYYYYM